MNTSKRMFEDAKSESSLIHGFEFNRLKNSIVCYCCEGAWLLLLECAMEVPLKKAVPLPLETKQPLMQ